MGLLVDWEIIELMDKGEIVISPFNRSQLNTVSYDVRLGEYFVRAREREIGAHQLFNPLSAKSISHRWGVPQAARKARDVLYEGELVSEEINPESLIILLMPGELILAHTMEFIGGVNSVTTAMHARSTTGRGGISVCMCAGWGDVGFYNCWTMEIRNNSDQFRVALPVGTPIAQISFDKVEEPQGSYSKEGNYQDTSNLELLQANWKPTSMLPKALS